jgi:hypothetical protein
MLWLVPLELESVLLDVNRSIKAKLYYPALLVSLTLPDICVATTLDRDMFVKEKHYVEWLERYTDKASLGISPIDCYRLRCGVVHRPEFAVVRKRVGIPASYQQLTHPRRLACAYKPAGRRLSRRRGSAWGWRSGAFRGSRRARGRWSWPERWSGPRSCSGWP